MKCILIYFSQTGNTEKIARAVQKGVQQAAGYCDIVKIKEANPRRLYEYDLIGLGSPAFGAAPDNVRIFVNNMRFVGGKHIFVFCTHGSGPEPFFPSLYQRMKSRGLTVIGMGDWYGDCYLLQVTGKLRTRYLRGTALLTTLILPSFANMIRKRRSSCWQRQVIPMALRRKLSQFL